MYDMFVAYYTTLYSSHNLYFQTHHYTRKAQILYEVSTLCTTSLHFGNPELSLDPESYSR